MQVCHSPLGGILMRFTTARNMQFNSRTVKNSTRTGLEQLLINKSTMKCSFYSSAWSWITVTLSFYVRMIIYDLPWSIRIKVLNRWQNDANRVRKIWKIKGTSRCAVPPHWPRRQSKSPKMGTYSSPGPHVQSFACKKHHGLCLQPFAECHLLYVSQCFHSTSCESRTRRVRSVRSYLCLYLMSLIWHATCDLAYRCVQLASYLQSPSSLPRLAKSRSIAAKILVELGAPGSRKSPPAWVLRF